MKYAYLKALLGVVVIDISTGKAIIINTLDVYGRAAHDDCHRERTYYVKGQKPQSSLPPTFGTRYHGLWVITLNSVDGPKPTIGTSSFNALVTSSMRVDTMTDSEVGPGISPVLTSVTKKNGTRARIYLDEEYWDAACEIVKNEEAIVKPQLCSYQVRQLRSKFGQYATYDLLRGSYFLVKYLIMQPYTVFAHVDYYDTKSSVNDGKLASAILKESHNQVLKYKQDARLKKSFVNLLKK